MHFAFQAQARESGLLLLEPCCFFFRPTPSWLSPGRYTHSTAADKLNCNLLARPSIESAASKELVVDQYKVQWAIPSKPSQTRTEPNKTKQTQATKPKTSQKRQRRDCNQQWELHAR